MRKRSGSVLIWVAALWSAAAFPAPETPSSAEAWLEQVPSLPTTAESAYSQWVDVSGTLKPGPAFERVADGIKSEVLTLARPVSAPTERQAPVSSTDRQLADGITVFPGTATVDQNLQAARTAMTALQQKWGAELGVLERHRLEERSALPACRNEAGAPSQIAIRDVERAYASRKIEITQRYLAELDPLVKQLLAAVAPRIEYGDATLHAWSRLHNASLKAQLAPIARGAESDALRDVGSVMDRIQSVSKLAARPVADLKALERVYAQAKGC
jgi:hypothetical protein